jgi:hypothetical protein
MIGVQNAARTKDFLKPRRNVAILHERAQTAHRTALGLKHDGRARCSGQCRIHHPVVARVHVSGNRDAFVAYVVPGILRQVRHQFDMYRRQTAHTDGPIGNAQETDAGIRTGVFRGIAPGVLEVESKATHAIGDGDLGIRHARFFLKKAHGIFR